MQFGILFIITMHHYLFSTTRVTALLPSLTDTDMVRELKLFRWVVPMTSKQVATRLIAGLRKDEPEILVGWQGCDQILM